MADREMTGHRHCWHPMKAGVKGNFFACCFGHCDDVLAAGSHEVEEKTHGLINWTPGRVLSIDEAKENLHGR